MRHTSKFPPGAARFAAVAIALCALSLVTCTRDYARHVAKSTSSLTVASVSPVTGANSQETALTIEGSNFTGSLSVYVGSAACTGVSAVSTKILNATLPAGLPEGVYDVTVVSATAGSGIAEDAFSVVDPTKLAVETITPAEGVNDAATPVTITGRAFVEPLTASLGETALSNVIVIDATSATAAVPAAMEAGFYDLTLVNPDGTQATLVLAFEVIDAEAIRVTSVEPASGSNLDDQEITITGANFVSPVSVYLGEIELNNPAPVLQSDTRVLAVVPAGFDLGVWDVRVENPDGESDTLGDGYTVTAGDDDADDDTADDDMDDDTADDDMTDDDAADDDAFDDDVDDDVVW
ncbi:IPT/TIG domain-containing protein [bacterium]|nr:IPT/TIG domain-containing protein [bacterium]